jgi:Na+-translocating ferredoxin:NAD+ oxidoreductase RnfG subunit
VAYIYLDKANSKSAQFDYVVFFDEELKIMFADVLIYREDYGGEIGSKRWLQQFYGKYNGQGMRFQQDIQNISGATISSRNITQAIQRLSKRIVLLQQKGLLD